MAAVCHQRDLAIARKTRQKHSEEAALVNLANAESELGEYDVAVDYYRQALALAKPLLGESPFRLGIGAGKGLRWRAGMKC